MLTRVQARCSRLTARLWDSCCDGGTMSESKDLRRLSRRDFVYLTSAGAGASLLAACQRDVPFLAPEFAQGGKGTVTRYPLHRSEERRVGKECRSRWSPY